MKTFRDRVLDFFSGEKTPRHVTEASSLLEIEVQIPTLLDFIERKYGVRSIPGDKQLTLEEFVAKYSLPPAQIVFMEAQLSLASERIAEVSAPEAKKLIDANQDIRILDVREEWEVKIARLPRSQVLNATLLDEILGDWPKERMILVYCHHGVRSLDAAHFLADRGFKNVHSIRGGIDSWATNVDPSIPRYTGNYC